MSIVQLYSCRETLDFLFLKVSLRNNTPYLLYGLLLWNRSKSIVNWIYFFLVITGNKYLLVKDRKKPYTLSLQSLVFSQVL